LPKHRLKWLSEMYSRPVFVPPTFQNTPLFLDVMLRN